MSGNTLTVTLSPTDNPNATLYGVATDNNRSATVFNGLVQGPADRITYLQNRLGEMIGVPVEISGVNATTDLITTSAAHGLSANDPVRIAKLGAGAVPGGLSAGTVYYWLASTTTTGKLALTPGGSAVDITTAGTGPLYLYKIPDAGELLYLVSGGEAGALNDAVVLVAGTQTVTGAKTFDDVKVSGVAHVKYESRSLERHCQAGPWVKLADGTCAAAIATLEGGASDQAEIVLDLPHGQVLTAIRVAFDPTNVGALPGTMPSIAMFRYPRTGGGEVAVGSPVTDSSGSTGAYNAVHDVEITGLSHTIDRSTNVYVLRVQGSSGSSPANDVQAFNPRAVVTFTSQREWV